MFFARAEALTSEECPVCHQMQSGRLIHARDVAFGTDEEYEYTRCLACSHLQLRVTAAIEPGTFKESAEGFVVSVMDHPLVSRAIYRPRIQWLARRMPLTPATVVLDVGCGTGQFLHLLKRQHGCCCLGIDFDPSFARLPAKDGVRIVCADFEEYVGDQHFDLITMFQVIEHFNDPAAAVCKAASLLRLGGYLCIETPASDSLAFALFQGRWLPLLAPYHRHVFSRHSLRMMLSKQFPAGQEVKAANVYIAGEIAGSACLPLARYAPHPFRQRKTPLWKASAATLGMGVAALLALPGEILIAATTPYLSIASHQRILYQKLDEQASGSLG